MNTKTGKAGVYLVSGISPTKFLAVTDKSGKAWLLKPGNYIGQLFGRSYHTTYLGTEEQLLED
jgi:hypothetical protein